MSHRITGRKNRAASGAGGRLIFGAALRRSEKEGDAIRVVGHLSLPGASVTARSGPIGVTNGAQVEEVQLLLQELIRASVSWIVPHAWQACPLWKASKRSPVLAPTHV